MARILKASKSGEPQPTQPRRKWPLRFVPTYRKLSVRTLIKRDEAKGVTMPEFGRITDKHGVITGAATRPNIVKQKPESPSTGTPGGAGKRVRAAQPGALRKR